MNHLTLLGSAIEAEGHDKRDINLPGKQLQLLQDTVSAGKYMHFTHILSRNLKLTVNSDGCEKLEETLESLPSV